MTALDKYVRLEGAGVWRETPDSQRRDVIVSLGAASLILTDMRSGMALSHWSLPAVVRLNRGIKPAVYAPAADAEGETLELDEPTLIEALDTIRDALAPLQPLRRLRFAMVAGTVVLTAFIAFWLPQVMMDRTAALVPEAMRQQIGRDALEGLALSPTAERICAGPEGRQALAGLRSRVLGPEWRVSVVAGVPGFSAAHLPGHLLVLGQDLVERLDSAGALAGWMLAETLAMDAHDPLLDALHYAGLRATFALMTTGTLPEGSLSGYAAQLFRGPVVWPSPDLLGARLDLIGVSPTAYALSLPPEAASLAEALADRPRDTARQDVLMLSDGEWLTLQQICAN